MNQPPDIDHLLVFFNSRSKRETKKTKSKKIYHSFLTLCMISGLVWGGYWLYENYARFIFSFGKNKYQDIAQKQREFQNKILRGEKIDEETNEGNDLEDHCEKLISSHPQDPILFYYYGLIQYNIFSIPIQKSNIIIADRILEQLIGRYRFSPKANHKAHQKAIILFRKALVLGLPIEQENEVKVKLSSLYFFSHSSYLDGLEDNLGENIREELGNIENPFSVENAAENERNNGDLLIDDSQRVVGMLLSSQTPDWESIEKSFSPMFITYLKAYYYLRLKNRPFGFSLLKKIVHSATLDEVEKQSNSSVSILSEEFPLINNALYLMGYFVRKNNRDSRKQFYFYSKIRFGEFLSRHPWFFDEYLLLLRFLGKYKKVKTFQKNYQKINKIND